MLQIAGGILLAIGAIYVGLVAFSLIVSLIFERPRQ